MDLFDILGGLERPFVAHCRVPDDLGEISDRGDEVSPREGRATRAAIETIWERAEALYRTGVQPAMQLCIRSRGHVVLDRAIGHARGNSPEDTQEALRVPITTRTPVNIFSGAKAITAMVIHKLDETGALHLEDRVCEFIPEFASHGKDRITLRHVLAHRAGIPNLPPESMDLDLLARPERMMRLLCDSEPVSAPGRLLAYHAVTGGFLLGEVIRRVTGHSIRDFAAKEFREPLGLEWLHYGLEPRDLDHIALNAFTGPPAPPLLGAMLRRALGADLHHVVEMSNDARFLTGVIPSANLFTTARDISSFYQCLLNEGELDGVRIFEPRTIQHAINEQSGFEIDLTLLAPIGYSQGFMLGNDGFSLFGWNHPQAFGHLGLSNTFCWADPERELVVSLLTTGKPILSTHVVRLFQLISAIHEAFSPLSRGRTGTATGTSKTRATGGTGARATGRTRARSSGTGRAQANGKRAR